MTWARRLALDVLAAGLGLAAVLVAVAAVLDGVELARGVVSGELAVGDWAVLVASGLPGTANALGPVAATAGGVLVLLWWRSTGRLDAVASVGIAPRSVLFAAATGGLGVVLVIGGVREVGGTWASSHQSVQGVWVRLEGATDRRVRAEVLGGVEAEGISFAEIVDGRLVAAAVAERGSWNGSAWRFTGVTGLDWRDEPPVAIAPDLPDPTVWRSRGRVAGPDASTFDLLAAPASEGRAAWLAERLATPVSAALLVVFAGGVTLSLRRWGGWLGAGGAVGFRVVQIGLLAAVPGGQWGLVPTLAAPLLVLALAAGLAAWRVSR